MILLICCCNYYTTRVELELEQKPSNNPQEITTLLRQLGLTSHQTKAYIALLSLGSAKPSEVARVAQLPRPNTYDALDALVGLGAATELSAKPKRYRASSPKIWLPELGSRLKANSEKAAELLDKAPRTVSPPAQINGWPRISALLRSGLSNSQERVLVDAHFEVFSQLEELLKNASRWGCEIAILCRGGDLPFQALSGWIVAKQSKLGPPDSCWVFDQEWALRYRGSGAKAKGRRLLDQDFASEIDRGILGQMMLCGDIASDSIAAKAIRRLYATT